MTEGTDNLIQVDQDYQTVLRNTYKYEFNANCNPDYHKELASVHEEEYRDCISRLQENSSITFELGIREVENKAKKEDGK